MKMNFKYLKHFNDYFKEIAQNNSKSIFIDLWYI